MRSNLFGLSLGLGAAALGLSVAGVALVSCGAPVAAIIALAGGSVATIRIGVRVSGTWASLTVIFAVFHIVYGLSGPVAALTGGALPDVFGTPYHLETFLAEYGLATSGLAVGLLLAAALGIVGLNRPPAASHSSGTLRGGILFVATGSIFELVNCLRAGGWPIIVQGKGIYQSAVSALVFTLPSSQVVSLGLVLSTLAVARRRHRGGAGIRLHEALGGLLALAPSLAIAIALGYRSPLFEWLLVVLLAAYYYTPLSRVSWRMGLLVIVVYLGSGLVYANRAIIGVGLVGGDWEAVGEAAFTRERLSVALNPAATEFGAAFGNFSEYAAGPPESAKLGATYLRALIVPIPGFLYPGRKPQQLGYEFRDRYFPSLAAESQIAGTAYSSLLEAYVNFGLVGGWLVYLVVGLLLAVAERIRQSASSIGWHLGYVLLVSDAVAFHRSDFGLVMGNLILVAVVIVFYLTCKTGQVWLSAAHVPNGLDLTESPYRTPEGI